MTDADRIAALEQQLRELATAAHLFRAVTTRHWRFSPATYQRRAARLDRAVARVFGEER